MTSRCNLKCPVCYEGQREIPEPSLQSLCEQLPKMHGYRISICGAEPTCRDDLPDLIRAINKKHSAILMTNGLKLADMKYLRSLREAGLQYVILAMNGLNDDVYRQTNGEALLDIKMKAMDNIEQLGMSIPLLSATITMGINEDQIGPLLELVKERKCINQLRLRSMANVGDYVEGGQLCMSELIKLICQQGGVDYDLLLKQQDYYDHIGRMLGVDYFRPRLCAMRLDFDKDLVPFATERDWQEWDNLVLKRPRLFVKLLQNYGLNYALHYIWGLKERYYYIPHSFRRIAVRVWPNLDTIDLDINKRCSSVYHRNGECLPFCLTNILKDT
ncbi:MAG: radical SAM protein [Deltaproteobacteria bacterium]|nr:radical SAM protein [Deltaproteobacteria bacterium]